MTIDSAVRPPRWFRVVATLALLWMLAGVGAWIADLLMTDAALAGLSEGQRTLYTTRPSWVFVVYGVAVFSGLAGAVALLMRRSWAVPALGLSLAALLVQFGYTFFVMDAIGHIGAQAAVPLPATVALIGVAVLWFARASARRGWLAARSRGGMHAEPVISGQ